MIVYLLFTLIALTCGQAPAHIPTPQELDMLADQVFKQVDNAPKDGIMSMSEWDLLMSPFDADNDSCITEAEYFAVSQLPPAVSDPIYKWLDENHDGCWSVAEINQKYRSMDENGDAQVNQHEYEVFYEKAAKIIFAHLQGPPGVGK